MPRTISRNSPGRRNFVAACVTVFSVGVLYSSFDPVPAGEENFSRSAPTAPQFDENSVPLPTSISGEVAATVEIAEVESSIPVDPDAALLKKSASGSALTNLESIQLCDLLLSDGERFINRFSAYTVKFHREERINGDMKCPQSIELKVQHEPHFAVYMRWLSGQKGQQVLYSDEYEDRCMVVKFGGFKRMLPALKLEPNSGLAMAETRYPVTEAGIGGMIRQLREHRGRDIKRNHGLTCTRLENQEFEGQDCYCFLLKYESREISKVYRKSLMMIDCENHIPVMVRNFTWSADTSLDGEQLDAATLIEDYSFTDLQIQAELVATDFSRENPRYRM